MGNRTRRNSITEVARLRDENRKLKSKVRYQASKYEAIKTKERRDDPMAMWNKVSNPAVAGGEARQHNEPRRARVVTVGQIKGHTLLISAPRTLADGSTRKGYNYTASDPSWLCECGLPMGSRTGPSAVGILGTRHLHELHRLALRNARGLPAITKRGPTEPQVGFVGRGEYPRVEAKAIWSPVKDDEPEPPHMCNPGTFDPKWEGTFQMDCPCGAIWRINRRHPEIGG